MKSSVPRTRRGIRRGLHIVALTVTGTAVLTAAQCPSRSAAPARVALTRADSADQKLFGMQTVLTNPEGAARARVRADSAFSYDEGLLWELYGVRMSFTDTAGAEVASVVATQGRYRVSEAVVEVSGGVVATAGEVRIETPSAQYSATTDMLSGETSFKHLRGTREQSGDGFTADPRILTPGPRPQPSATPAPTTNAPAPAANLPAPATNPPVPNPAA